MPPMPWSQEACKERIVLQRALAGFKEDGAAMDRRSRVLPW